MSGTWEFSGTGSGITFYSGNTNGIVGATSPQTGAGLTIVSNIRTPVNDYDAATKKYVDGQDATLESNLKEYVDEKIPAAQIQSDWSQTDATKKDYIKNKPTIPAAQIQSDWSQTDTTKKDFIKNKPTIPAA